MGWLKGLGAAWSRTPSPQLFCCSCRELPRFEADWVPPTHPGMLTEASGIRPGSLSWEPGQLPGPHSCSTRSPERNAYLLLSFHLQEVSPTSPLKPKSLPVTHSPPTLLISFRRSRIWDPHNCFDQSETCLSIREDPANNYSGTITGVNLDHPRQTRTSSLPRLSTHSTSCPFAIPSLSQTYYCLRTFTLAAPSVGTRFL